MRYIKPTIALFAAVLILAACAGGAALTETPIAPPTTPAAVVDAPTDTVAPATSTWPATTAADRAPTAAALPTSIPIEVPPGLELAALKAATYRTGFTNSGSAILQDGVYTEPSVAGGASLNTVTLQEPVTYGRLPDGRVVAAVILASETGGSGTFYELELMGLLENGSPLNLAYTFLGDRVKIQSVEFMDDGSLVVDMLTAGPNDPLAAPTLPQRLTLRYLDGQLVKETPIAPLDPTEAPSIITTPPLTATLAGQGTAPTTLQGTVWQWVEFENSSLGRLVVKNPYLYLLEFTSGGEARVNADCNSGAGSYQAQNGSLKITNLTTTLAACGPDSLYSLYMESLNNIESYMITNGALYLTVKDQGGIMKFGPQP